ncbi:MAG TPA: N-acetylmuramoyl-L-alanine amidase CwlD [Clostridiales bacterium]|nr:N-acetylmuramoyl-L-alanine amidase CwlD [Clostridiales bacterium]
MLVICIRKKWILLFFVGIIAICGLSYGLWKYKTSVAFRQIILNKVIVIDPGHGGVDGGAVGKSGTVESHINLSIAQELRKLLEESGAYVIMTRESDVGLYTEEGTIRKKKNEDLRNRKKIQEESYADIFVSIHLNSFQQSRYFGAQTFYPLDCEESRLLAESIQKELIRVLKNGNNRIAKPKNDILLLKDCKIPTVLVECGFLSNPREEKLLQKPSYQKKIAWSIYIGILNYFQQQGTDAFMPSVSSER